MPIFNSTPDEVCQRFKAGKVSVAVFGLGRIGLPTALSFADTGALVYGVDVQESLIELIKNRNVYLDEPGIPELLARVLDKKRFIATSNYQEAMKHAEVCIICVPTPITNGKYPDYSSIIQVCNTSLRFLKLQDLVIIESTISPGTIENLIIPLIAKNTGLQAGIEFGIACCPERADPGTVLANIQQIPRVVGGYTMKSTKLVAALYRCVTSAKIFEVRNARTASAVKLTENIFRDVNIALMNELAILYEKLGIDIVEIIKAASTKYNFQPHYPGAGVGGPCLPANPYYLIQEGIQVGFVPLLIRMAREINDRMPQHIIDLTLQALNRAGKSAKNAKIVILGITYKPGVHDFQLSPAIPVIQRLAELDATLIIYDPLLQPNDISQLPFLLGLKTVKNLDEIPIQIDCFILVTAHPEFKQIDFLKLKSLSSKPLIIVDGRNLFNSNELPKDSIYIGVGRGY